MDELLLTSEVAKILKCNLNTVNDYINAGLLPRLKIGRISKCRRLAVEEFMKKYEGYDLTDPYNVKPIEQARQMKKRNKYSRNTRADEYIDFNFINKFLNKEDK